MKNIMRNVLDKLKDKTRNNKYFIKCKGLLRDISHNFDDLSLYCYDEDFCPLQEMFVRVNGPPVHKSEVFVGKSLRNSSIMRIYCRAGEELS